MADHSMLHEWVESVRERQTPEWLDWAMQGIESAVVFHVGDFADVPAGRPDQWQVLKPPFPVTVLEFNYSYDHQRSSGLLLCVESHGADGFYVIPAEKDGGGWVTGHAVRGWRDELGQLQHEASNGEPVNSVLLSRWCLPATVFNLLKCVNVSVTDHLAPAKLNAKRAARGKVPLYSFKTLQLRVPNERKQGGHLGGTHASPRLHLRRGHIRQISEGRSVWVQSCVVGSGPGIVEKDYRLVAKAAGA